MLTASEIDRLQRRTLRVLVAGQALGGLGLAGAAGGALLALELTGSRALASLPLAMTVLGSAATVLPVAAHARRAGRRPALAAALLLSAACALAVAAAAAVESYALLLAASFGYGAGNTAVLLARYAAADLSAPES
ncbi:MAG TPA: hypothetical protein VIL49_10060, partial [Capillimicrobium sp.]